MSPKFGSGEGWYWWGGHRYSLLCAVAERLPCDRLPRSVEHDDRMVTVEAALRELAAEADHPMSAIARRALVRASRAQVGFFSRYAWVRAGELRGTPGPPWHAVAPGIDL